MVDKDEVIHVELPELDFEKDFSQNDIITIPQHWEESTKDHEPYQYLYILYYQDEEGIDHICEDYYVKYKTIIDGEEYIHKDPYDTRVQVNKEDN